MLLFSQNSENAAYLWEFIMAYKEGFGTIYCIPQFPPEDLPRQSASPRVLRFLGENFSFMGGKSVVRLGDQNFKSYNFEDFFPYYHGSPNVGTHDKMLVKITHLLNLTFPWSDITSRLRST